MQEKALQWKEGKLHCERHGEFDGFEYGLQSKTAKLTADAPGSKASELLRAAMDGGHTGNVTTFGEVVKGDFL